MNDADTLTALRHDASILLQSLEQNSVAAELRQGELSELIYDAEAREHRRAMRHQRDSSCYRLGSAFEASGGLSLDPIALSGWLALGELAALLLVRQMLAAPGQSITEHLAALFSSSVGDDIRSWGVWVRWHWLRTLYEAETTAFLASPAARRPGWRRQDPTARQTALIASMCEFLQKDPQRVRSRGDAFEWINVNGAHPRFHKEPAKPDLAHLQAALL